MSGRYFLDIRSGIGAVRDRFYTDPEYNGLHADTEGVIVYRPGFKVDDHWEMLPADVAELREVCNRLNGIHEWQRYVCGCGAPVVIKYYPQFEAKCRDCGLTWEGEMK